jgi:hypothetical protein
MKKLALAAAIAAAVLSTGAYAARPVVSTITDVELVVSGVDMEVPCPSGSTAFTIDGANTNQIQMLGNLCMDPSGVGSPPFIRLTFATVTGEWVSGVGTTFGQPSPPGTGGGSIQIDVQTTDGWVPYGTVAVATSNIDCTTATGIAGLQVVGGTNIVEPGLSSGGSSLAICDTTLFGQSAQFFIKN